MTTYIPPDYRTYSILRQYPFGSYPQLRGDGVVEWYQPDIRIIDSCDMHKDFFYETHVIDPDDYGPIEKDHLIFCLSLPSDKSDILAGEWFDDGPF